MPERFSASVAARHMACPASANLPLAIPNWTPPVVDRSPAASAGTLKHEMLEPIMKLTQAEIQQFAVLLTYVSELRATRKFKVLVEEEVQAAWLNANSNTTADLVLFTADEIHILDWKWGRIPVEVVNNKQLLFYAACYAALSPRAKGVMLHIVQPPLGVAESWFASTTVIGDFMADAIKAERAIAGGDVTFGPSDNCTFCPANPHSRGVKGKPLCPAMMKLLYPDHTDEDAILAL
jgi:Protein of unknown function (DUF2800)